LLFCFVAAERNIRYVDFVPPHAFPCILRPAGHQVCLLPSPPPLPACPPCLPFSPSQVSINQAWPSKAGPFKTTADRGAAAVSSGVSSPLTPPCLPSRPACPLSFTGSIRSSCRVCGRSRLNRCSSVRCVCCWRPSPPALPAPACVGLAFETLL
jgi:hypothetical protein